ncbi:MAG TPA: DUF3943 domain-containing protein [Polyangiaceae bacterium]|nr:DUF3943 domain-containing protein [Polyangiaceae bacterium]
MSRRLLKPPVIVALAFAALWPRPVRADEADERNQALLTYTTPQQPHYLRVGLEELAIFGAGIAQYWYDKSANSRDWQFKYDWPSLRERLEGKAYSFDSNGFDTNFLFHPFSGTLYYSSARANHLGPFESLAVAFTTSFLWEFFGEFQERPSINDIIVTPYAGMAWGETTTQLGAFFLRGCPTTANTILGSTLAPFVALHDAADGATRVHSDCAESSSAHRFRLSLSGGEAWTEGISAYPQVTGKLDTEVIHLSGFARPGVGWATFADGNVSRLGVDVSLAEPRSSEVTDFTLLTQTVVAGLHYRNNYIHGSHIDRHEVLFGLLIGAEYSRHRYLPGTAANRVFLLELPAFTMRYYGRSRELGWELTLDAGGAYGAADALALPAALANGSKPDLTSVAQAEGYNHVAGITMNPRVRVDLGPTELGLDLRSDRLYAFRAADRTNYVAKTPTGEFRRRASLWMSFGAPWVERFLLSLNWTNRTGTVGDTHVARNELSLNAGVELAP